MALSFASKASPTDLSFSANCADSTLTSVSRGFLPSREGYSDQLKSYLEAQDGNINHTCITYFNEKKAALQKTATKLLKRYQNGDVIIRHITPSEFRYVRPEE